MVINIETFGLLGLIEHVYPNDENLFRKVLVTTIIYGQPRLYVRPITQTVLLCHSEL